MVQEQLFSVPSSVNGVLAPVHKCRTRGSVILTCPSSRTCGGGVGIGTFDSQIYTMGMPQKKDDVVIAFVDFQKWFKRNLSRLFCCLLR